MPVALITGGTRGLGRALVLSLAHQGWDIITDGRRVDAAEALSEVPVQGYVTTIQGDVADATHRSALGAAVRTRGRLDLLVNNASELGPSPLPYLRTLPLTELARVFAVNVLAPVALFQAHRDLLHESRGTVVNISSDAAEQAYAGWGGYGAAKSALDHASAVLAVEEPDLCIYAFDPGDMNTEMHRRAAPSEDLSALPLPAEIVPHLLTLIRERPVSGRYRAEDIASRDSRARVSPLQPAS